MSVSISPVQARAFRTFVATCLSYDEGNTLEDPAPFTSANVLWEGQDHPRLGTYAVLDEIALTSLQPLETFGRYIEDDDVIRLHHRMQCEWVAEVQVVIPRSDTAPSLSVSANQYLRRLMLRFQAESFIYPLRVVGLAPMRCGQISDLTRLARNAQWQSRAGLTLTLSAMPTIIEETGTIENVTGTLELDAPASDDSTTDDIEVSAEE